MESPDAPNEQIKDLKKMLAETQRINQQTRELLTELDSIEAGNESSQSAQPKTGSATGGPI